MREILRAILQPKGGAAAECVGMKTEAVGAAEAKRGF
jgi:hypothetical protein